MAENIRTYGAVPDGITDATASINAALLVSDIIINNGVFLLGSSIRIPSNRTIYIKNAKLKMGNATYDNIFRNSDFTNGNSNISIIGQGNAVLDGNSANNDDDYATHPNLSADNTSTTAYMNLLICMYKVNGLTISGISIVDHSHWCIMFQNVQNFSLHDIYLNHYTTTVNQDGIDLLHNTNTGEIYNIRGYSKDDFIAINLLNYPDLAVNIAGSNVGDCHDIDIHDNYIYNSTSGAFLALVPFLGNNIYNINYEDTQAKSSGSVLYTYGMSDAGEDACRDITMDSLIVNTITTRTHAVMIKDDCKNITITNLINNSGKPDFTSDGGLTIENFTLNGAAKP